jgi:hypothetical protein
MPTAEDFHGFSFTTDGNAGSNSVVKLNPWKILPSAVGYSFF